jgi:hypothetical protein
VVTTVRVTAPAGSSVAGRTGTRVRGTGGLGGTGGFGGGAGAGAFGGGGG